MASGIISALAPSVIGSLTGGGGKDGGGLIGSVGKGIGSFVTGLLRGKGFKESLAGGIDTMAGLKSEDPKLPMGDKPKFTSPLTQATAQMAKIEEAKASPQRATYEHGPSSGSGILSNKLDITIQERRGQYVVAVIPMQTFKKMVILYMIRRGYSRESLTLVIKEIDGGMAAQEPGQRGGSRKYGFPLLAQSGTRTRSSQYLYPEYGASPPPVPIGTPAGGGGSV